MKAISLLLVLLLGTLLMIGCSEDESTSIPESTPAHQYDSETAAAWFETTYHAIQAASFSPPVAARIIGYASVALYEATVPGMNDHRTLAGQLNDLGEMPPPQSGVEYHWPTVAGKALATVLRALFSNAPAAALDSIIARDAAFAAQFQATVPQDVYDRSVAQGELVGLAIFDWSQTDGYAAHNNCPYTPPTGPGLWVPTPPNFAAALQPCWGQVRPMAMGTGDACLPPAPLAYSTDTASTFYHDAREVYDVATHLTDEQRTIANFWADNAGAGGTPPGHSISILTQIVRRNHVPLDSAAEAYARVGIAVNDAFISCWQAKYVYNLLRPVTYIQSVMDAGWLPMLATPAFPEYTSGHSVQSSAVAEVLTAYFGAMPFVDSTHVAQGMAPRSFNTFSDFANEAALSRLYAGIHFRTAIERGLTQGSSVAQFVNMLMFRPVRPT